MGIAKIIEVVSEGKTVDEAFQNAVSEVSKTIHGVKGVELIRVHGIVENNKIVKYRLDAKVAFVVDR